MTKASASNIAYLTESARIEAAFVEMAREEVEKATAKLHYHIDRLSTWNAYLADAGATMAKPMSPVAASAVRTFGLDVARKGDVSYGYVGVDSGTFVPPTWSPVPDVDDAYYVPEDDAVWNGLV